MRILIADDQPRLLRHMGELLGEWGYEVIACRDGRAALEGLLAPDAPRLALLDWEMPGVDGIEVCRLVRQEPDLPYAYLVLMTGVGGREPMLAGLEAGADDFLAKPVDPAELKARLGTGQRIVSLQEELRRMATRDALTGIWNRAAVLGILHREMARAGREDRPLAVAMADVDRFKAVNDTHGHLAGDEVLREVARRMRAALRPYDALGRYGGEEFLALLPGCDGRAAMALAERLRACVATKPVEVDGKPLAVTISLGVAVCKGAPTGPSALLKAADDALYRAKRGGRDRVEMGESLLAATCAAPG